MGAQPIVCRNVGVDLKPSPIEPSWIRGGTPTARNALLATSRDRASCTLVWDCSPGAFEWRYDTDETVHILQGSVVLDDGFSPPRRIGPGDVVLFPAGAVVRWTVETHVRKLAFFHRPMPAPLSLLAVTIVGAWRMGCHWMCNSRRQNRQRLSLNPHHSLYHQIWDSSPNMSASLCVS